MKIKKIKNKFMTKQIIFGLILMFVFPLFFSGSVTNAETNYPKIDIETSTKQINTAEGNEFEIRYKLTPNPIPVNEVNPNLNVEKNIVLVIDTSGSMNDYISNDKTKMDALKIAAKNFINKFKDLKNVNIGIVTYNRYAIKNTSLVSSKYNYETLYNAIDNLKSNGSTNIGDGIRVGTKMLLSANNDSKKYLILMSDGEPTSLSYKSEDVIGDVEYYKNDFGNNSPIISQWYYKYYDYGKYYRNYWNYFGINDNDKDLKIGDYSNYDPSGYCFEYSKIMSQNIYKNNISNFFIGFSEDSNREKLMQMANIADGKPENNFDVKNYFDADTPDAINNVYSNIAEKIKKEYVVQNINVNLNLKKDFEISQNEINIEKLNDKYIKHIPNIVYKLNESKTYYEADPIEITVRLKSKNSGSYIIGGENSNDSLTYDGLKNNTISEKLPKINIDVQSFDGNFEISRKIIPESLNGQVDINKPFKIQYTIKPKPIPFKFDNKPKKIMLVVDTSGSMIWDIANNYEPYYGRSSRLELLKKALKNFMNKFKDVDNVEVGITEYNEKASVINFGTKHNPKYFVSTKDINSINMFNQDVEKLEAGGATNIGDGIRRGLWALNQNGDEYNKYIIVMTDGEPTALTYYPYYKNDETSQYRNYPNLDAPYYYYVNDDIYNELLDSSIYSDLNNVNGIEYLTKAHGEHWSYVTKKDLNYAKLMASKIKDYNVKPFFIGFSSEADENKLKDIANSTKLNDKNLYFDATKNDENAINDVYMNIADKIKADFLLDGSFNENFPKEFTVSEKANDKLQFKYVYNKEKQQYEAPPIVYYETIIPNKVGKYTLSKDASFSYTNLNGTVKTMYFNDLNINVNDNYIIQQGLFEPSNETGNYIKSVNSLNIVNDATNRVGVYVRTSGQNTNININLNDTKSKDLDKIYDIKVNVYKINSDGKLELCNDIKSTINGDLININLPSGNIDTSGYNHYVINYDFKAKSKDNTNVSFYNLASIQEANANSNLNFQIGELPDLF